MTEARTKEECPDSFLPRVKSEIAEDVVTDPMVFCTTVYIVIYILLLLQSFVASSVQFVNEGTWEFRVCSTLLLRWAAPAGIDSLPCILRIIIGIRRNPATQSLRVLLQQYSPGLRINEEGLQSSHAQIHNVRDAGVVVDSYGGSSMEVETRQCSCHERHNGCCQAV